MSSQPWWHWLTFGGGVALAAAGAVLLLWSIFWDRSRGRRRCPKCWYHMTGVPGLTCPECGRQAKLERELHRTRRRWMWAAVALCTIAAGHLLERTPEIRLHGWWAAAPRPVLALLVPWVTGEGGGGRSSLNAAPLELEIRRRFFAGRLNLKTLWPGERWLVSRGAAAALGPNASHRANLLAADLFVLTVDDPVAPAPEAGKGRVVLARSALAYARCTTYRDIGLVKGTVGARDEKPFITAFRRSGPFRFEFLGGRSTKKKFSLRYVMWGTEPKIRKWWTLQLVFPRETYALDAIAGEDGSSGGSGGTIPRQLFRSGSWVTVVPSPELIGIEPFDGRDCYHVRSKDILNRTAEFWIDSKDFGLRKIKRHGDSPTVIVYRPEFNAAIPDEYFAFDPTNSSQTPLGDGEAACESMLALAGDPRDGAEPVQRPGKP